MHHHCEHFYEGLCVLAHILMFNAEHTCQYLCDCNTHMDSYAHIHSAIDGTSYKSLSVVCKNQRLNFLKFINLLKDREIQYEIQ